MSLPRFFLPSLPESGLLKLSASESLHASNVLRLKVGDRVVVFDGQGNAVEAELTEVSKKSTSAQVLGAVPPQDDSPELHLAVSLPKGDRQKVLIDSLTQLGVKCLTPLICSRGVAKPTGNAVERLERSVVEACKQCQRNTLMLIHEPLSVEQLVVKDEAEIRDALKLIAHPYKADSLKSTPAEQPVIAMVGPEGGFTEEEVELSTRAGWVPIRLGHNILRVETAAGALASWSMLRSSS